MLRKLLAVAKVLWLLAFGGGAVFMVFLGFTLGPVFFKMAIFAVVFAVPVVLWEVVRGYRAAEQA